jgi:hypothetical protein
MLKSLRFLTTSVGGVVLSLALLPAAYAAPLFTVVPPNAPNVSQAQGPAPLRFPGSGGARTQQVYESQLFNNFSGARLITGFDLRAFSGAAPSIFFGNSVSVSQLEIRLSTTQRGDEGNELSTQFNQNLGADLTSVFSGALTLRTAANGATPNPFDYSINFTNPFLYDPSLGNLLIEFLIPSTAVVSIPAGFGFLTFDTVNALNDGTFSVFSSGNGIAASGTAGTSAPVLRIRSEVAQVSEPATLALMGAGLVGLGFASRRKRKSA